MNLYFVFILSNSFHYICSAALDQSLLVSGCCVLCNVLVCKIWDIFKHAQSYLCISGSYGFKQVQYKNIKFEFIIIIIIIIIIITDFDYSPEYVRLACFCPVMRNSVLCANESPSPNVFMFLWNNHLYVRNQAHTGWDKIWKYFWVRYEIRHQALDILINHINCDEWIKYCFQGQEYIPGPPPDMNMYLARTRVIRPHRRSNFPE